jgi:Predicted periplasmic lipoprotein (DUF2279)
MKRFLFFFLTLTLLTPLFGQRFLSLQPADTLHKGRFWTAMGVGTAAYSASMYGLYNAWYKDYPLGKFHVFNDNREWNQMDKLGHLVSAYNESKWVFGGARWVGLSPKQAAWAGFAGGMFIQTSFEVFDGFSEQWGWSWGDILYNTLGSGLFLGQELAWHDQRILIKISSMPVDFPDDRIFPYNPLGNQQWTTLDQRANELYGTGPVDLFLKNYNSSVMWASVNPRAFIKNENSWVPRWLNIAVGMGADNMFEGFGYSWQADKSCKGPDCITYSLDPNVYPRSRQFFLSLDVDLTRIRVKNRFVRSLLYVANMIKVPAPTLEWNTKKGVFFHLLYF